MAREILTLMALSLYRSRANSKLFDLATPLTAFIGDFPAKEAGDRILANQKTYFRLLLILMLILSWESSLVVKIGR